MRILCPWCHAWFSFDTPDGFFPHLIDAHPQSAQARAVSPLQLPTHKQSTGEAPDGLTAPQFAFRPTGWVAPVRANERPWNEHR